MRHRRVKWREDTRKSREMRRKTGQHDEWIRVEARGEDKNGGYAGMKEQEKVRRAKRRRW